MARFRPRKPEVEPTLTILPGLPCATICLAAYLLNKNGPVNVTAITRSHSSLVMSRICLLSEIAALLTRISIFPHSPTTSLTRRSISDSLATSATNAIASPPAFLMSAATLSPRTLSRSTTAIFAPSEASSFAVSSPILRPAPVMIATCPFSFIIVSLVWKSPLRLVHSRLWCAKTGLSADVLRKILVMQPAQHRFHAHVRGLYDQLRKRE